MKRSTPLCAYLLALLGAIFCLSNVLRAQEEKGRIVEEIVVRVNNEIITLSEYQGAEASLEDETRQDCPGCPPEKFQEMLKTRRANLLRDLIDQSLLAQKGKDLGLNVEADVVKRLDQLRQQYGWKDMDEMETQLRVQGISLEDYKNTLRNGFLTQEVVRQQVSSHIQVTREEEEKYYQEHQSEFNRPEHVVLSEFFLSTEKKSESEIPGIEEKAKGYLARIQRGDSFEELAKRFSEGSTAKDGGFLGSFERGQLSKEIEDKVFAMKKGEVTEVTRTKTGFLILLVMEHYDAGIQPLDKVRNEIENRLVYERTQPELRKYLATLREESYLIVKPGYTDTAAVAGTQIVEVDPAAAPAAKSDKKSKKSKKDTTAAADPKAAGSGPSQ
ncbi:MAG TPA: peptidylprolyl isomerase [Candidatus Acidoferrales bacterium]|nr:peptidylprolyl isomerase [Candidatus Acidoferrales bacterium]